MGSPRLGIGIIGAGFIGRFHIRSFVGVRDADITGIVSGHREGAEEAAALAQSLGVGSPAVHDTITELVADPAVDAIWITAPNHLRIEMMEEIVHAVTSGKGSLIGIACEKPLARNVAEARRMVELVREANLIDGYLEDQVFQPAVIRGKEIIWRRGVATSGRPYLARAAEEHSGPHMPWFWEGELQGGGVINDMMCHSVETAQYMLTPPDTGRDALTPVKVTAHASCLKWQDPKYVEYLREMSGGTLDYRNRPAEDFGRSLIEYRDAAGEQVIVETTTSWCYVGAGLRLSLELLGPEYSLQINSLDTDLKVFFSRQVTGSEGEDLVEKQNAEIGLMPVVPDEESAYGYTNENRHMVRSFLEGRRPMETFEDGLRVTRLLMTAYMSAEQERTIPFPPPDLDTYIPSVARGAWNLRGDD
jgi:predicted dehydrogenase